MAEASRRAVELSGELNPFVRYRKRLDSYRKASDAGLADDEFVDLVTNLDRAVERVGGVSFRVTPVIDGAPLIADVLPGLRLDVKVDAGNVGGSHKARHLFGVALHLLVDKASGTGPLPDRLAIASCGNAAIGAATVARALDVEIEVFVPRWADASTIAILDDLGATIHRCDRLEGELGDPCHRRFREAVANGAHPFSVQGTDTPTTFDGGRTLGWEIEEQVGIPDGIWIQVGGGALAVAVGSALDQASLHPVQSEGCAPLDRAWRALRPEFDFDHAEQEPDSYMTPWANPESFATGILDDVTYDWLPLLMHTHRSGGQPVVAPEATIRQAWDLARARTDVPVCSTGTAGLAGLLASRPETVDHAVVVFTGVDRT